VALRTRIAVTFLLLLAAVLAAALGAVSATNRGNAEREVQRQLDVGASVFSRLLESNRRQLTQAAQAVAADYGFREAVSSRDTDTLVSVLENSGQRMGAAMVVLTSLNGDVIAASGLHVKAGTPFPPSPVGRMAGDNATSLMVDNGRIYQLVTVSVRSPLPVAWIAMGFELDDKAARELADITGLAVTLSVNSGGHWTDVVSTMPAGGARPSDIVARRIEMSKWGNAEVVAILSRSLSDARAPFERLTKVLFLIASVSLIASALAAFWLARNITRPLQDLTQAVDQMRAGTYDGTLSVQRPDELGVLAEGLQLMQTAVQSRDQSIRRLAYEDSLTGLMNRTAFSAALGRALTEAGGAPVAVAVINLDRFRRINEHLGYSVGDAVLIKMAARLAAVPSVESAVARFAADQFAAFTQLRKLRNIGTRPSTRMREARAIREPADRLSFLIQRHLSVILDNRELYLTFIREVRASESYATSAGRQENRRYTSLLRDTLQQAMESGSITCDLDASTMRDLVYGGVEHVAWSAIVRGDSVTLDKAEVAKRLAATFVRGFGLKPASSADHEARLRRIERHLGL